MTDQIASSISRVLVFDGAGTAREGDLAQTPDLSAKGFCWIHLVQNDPQTLSWLDQANLDPIVRQAITADETRPRCTQFGEGAILILRGVNLNDGERPEDMVSVRLWITDRMILSFGLRSLQAISDLQTASVSAHASKSPGDLIGRLTQRLADRAEPTVAALNEQLDDLEETLLGAEKPANPASLGDVRRAAIALRRYMVPQRDALTTLMIEDFNWLARSDLARLREASDRITLLAENLDAIRDRAQILHDQLADQRSLIMNQQMFVLSGVAAIFLPLGLITGLLGINVGGVPGTGYQPAFWIVCAGLGVLCGGLVWLFRRWGLF